MLLYLATTYFNHIISSKNKEMTHKAIQIRENDQAIPSSETIKTKKFIQYNQPSTDEKFDQHFKYFINYIEEHILDSREATEIEATPLCTINIKPEGAFRRVTNKASHSLEVAYDFCITPFTGGRLRNLTSIPLIQYLVLLVYKQFATSTGNRVLEDIALQCNASIVHDNIGRYDQIYGDSFQSRIWGAVPTLFMIVTTGGVFMCSMFKQTPQQELGCFLQVFQGKNKLERPLILPKSAGGLLSKSHTLVNMIIERYNNMDKSSQMLIKHFANIELIEERKTRMICSTIRFLISIGVYSYDILPQHPVKTLLQILITGGFATNEMYGTTAFMSLAGSQAITNHVLELIVMQAQGFSLSDPEDIIKLNNFLLVCTDPHVTKKPLAIHAAEECYDLLVTPLNKRKFSKQYSSNKLSTMLYLRRFGIKGFTLCDTVLFSSVWAAETIAAMYSSTDTINDITMDNSTMANSTIPNTQASANILDTIFGTYLPFPTFSATFIYSCTRTAILTPIAYGADTWLLNKIFDSIGVQRFSVRPAVLRGVHGFVTTSGYVALLKSGRNYYMAHAMAAGLSIADLFYNIVLGKVMSTLTHETTLKLDKLVKFTKESISQSDTRLIEDIETAEQEPLLTTVTVL